MLNSFVTAQDAVNLLNEAAKLDPHAVEALIKARIPANEALQNHPTIQCSSAIGVLGMLNGLFGVFPEGHPKAGWGPISAIISDDGSPIRFELTEI